MSSPNDPRERLEQTPMAALALHWCSSVFLILVTIPAKPTIAYNILVNLYSYTIIVLVGAWVSFGLLLTKLRTEKFHWKTRRRYRPIVSPAHAIVYFSACCFVLVCAFVPPSTGSPYAPKQAGIKWYIIPTIGLSSPLWGLIWYYAFMLYQRQSKWDLQVDRQAFWMKDPDNPEEYIQRAEVVSHFWTPRAGRQERATYVDHGEEINHDSDNGRQDPGAFGGHTFDVAVRNGNPRDYVGGLVGRNRNLGLFGEEGHDNDYQMRDYDRNWQ